MRYGSNSRQVCHRKDVWHNNGDRKTRSPEEKAASRVFMILPLSGGVTFFLYFQLFDIAALRFVSLRTKGKAAMLAVA